MVYFELEKKDLATIWKVLWMGTLMTTIAYLFAGIFGYVTFSQYPLSDIYPYNMTVGEIMGK
jgi:amino acid permease